MAQPKKIFVICPVRNAEPDIQEKISEYVANLEAEGHEVYWPARDTEQQDPTGGLQICRANFREIMEANEIHIWYDETSGGSKFDLGGVFMLVEMLRWHKRIVIINEKEAAEKDRGLPKSHFQVSQYLVRKTCKN